MREHDITAEDLIDGLHRSSASSDAEALRGYLGVARVQPAQRTVAGSTS